MMQSLYSGDSFYNMLYKDGEIYGPLRNTFLENENLKPQNIIRQPKLLIKKIWFLGYFI